MKTFTIFSRHKTAIEFYDILNLNELLLSYSVAPHHPGPMCTTSPTNLLYVDLTEQLRGVKALDCSASHPKAATSLNLSSIRLNGLLNLCYVKDRNKHLLITTHDWKAVSAYDVTSGELEWTVKGKLPGMNEIAPCGVLTDGRGHLLVSDLRNAALQMLSLDGKYLGAAVRAGEQGLGSPWFFNWCDQISCFAVVHRHHDASSASTQNAFHEISILKSYL